jgi:transposase
MPDPEIDVQNVINRLTNQIAQMTAEIAVKDALIEAYKAQAAAQDSVVAEPVPAED